MLFITKYTMRFNRRTSLLSFLCGIFSFPFFLYFRPELLQISLTLVWFEAVTGTNASIQFRIHVNGIVRDFEIYVFTKWMPQRFSTVQNSQPIMPRTCILQLENRMWSKIKIQNTFHITLYYTFELSNNWSLFFDFFLRYLQTPTFTNLILNIFLIMLKTLPQKLHLDK